MREKTMVDKICELFLYFIMYAMIGWIYEVVLEVFIYKWGYSDRGVLIGSWPWQTYLDYEYNFQGRIALSPSIRFGLGGAFFLYILQPLFEKLTAVMGSKVVRNVATIVGIIFLSDVVYTFFIK